MPRSGGPSSATRFYSSLPVVGRHLEPFAGLTAMMLYGGHYAPTALRGIINRRIGGGVEAAAPANADDEPVATASGSRVPPYLRFRAQRERCLYRSSVQYGSHPAQLLD